MKISKYKLYRLAYLHIGCLLAACSLLALSCADNNFENDNKNADNGTAIAFNVTDVQNETTQATEAKAAFTPMTRAIFTKQLTMQALTPEDLISQKLPAQGSDGNDACLIETTVPGVNPMKKEAVHTRANITTLSTLKHFSSIGYRGATKTDISTIPWFYNADIKPDGTFVNPIQWSWEQPYGKFYAIYPQATAAYTKLKLSPQSHTSTPYVDFEVENDVKKQKDLMTASSGIVHYATRFVTPEANLRFHHALTAVRFKVGSNLSWNKTIDKVEIRHAMSKGRYTLSSDETGSDAQWSDLSDPTTFTLGGDGTVSVSTKGTANQIIIGNSEDNYTFYMIPQGLAGVSVYVHFSDGTDITANLSGTWKPGTTKTYALSQNTSTWKYQLTVTSLPEAAYTATSTSSYTVQSYRIDPTTHIQQPVAWKIVEYQESTDNGVTWSPLSTTKPTWLTALSKEEGDGGTAAESGTATITKNITDRLDAYNKVMQDAPAKGSAGNYYNLANSTGAATVENTANCYLISAPGYYCIPLVYGNAIKNGKDNPSSYQTKNTGSYILRRFKDHNGTEIQSPYINVQNKRDPAIQASIVWTDQSGIVDGLSVTNSGMASYLKFHIPEDKIKNGNAVIAVKNTSGTIMWSWHLWFDHSDVLNTIAVKNHQGVTYNFTKQTLGFAYRKWEGSPNDKARIARIKVEQTIANDGKKEFGYIDIKQKPGSNKEISSTLYQFGRKDAMPGVVDIADGSFTKQGSYKITIAKSIQNPGVFYTWQENWWADNHNQSNLWSINNTYDDLVYGRDNTVNDNNVTKSIYDPCPAGFKMPSGNAFSGFNKTGNTGKTDNTDDLNVSGDWDIGWHFNSGYGNTTIYFPCTGFLDISGTYLPDNLGGFYWSADPQSKSNGWYLTFSSGGLQTAAHSYRAYGISVRPVKE